MRVLAALLALSLTACTAANPVALPTPTPTREPGLVSVTVLLDLSGPRTPSGESQRNAMQLWLDDARAGSTAVKLKVKLVDVRGSDASLLIELRRAVVEDHADAIVVGTPAALDDTLARAAALAAVPVILTLPAPDPLRTAAGRSTFALAPTPSALASLLATDLLGRAVRAPLLLVSDETPTALVERHAFATELDGHGYTPPLPLVVTANDAAQKMQAPLGVAKSVVVAGAPARYVDALRRVPPGSDAPLVYLSYLTEPTDLAALRDASGLVTWPGSRPLATISATTAVGPRARFVQAFTTRHGAPSTLAATAYDALGLIDAAARLAPDRLDGASLRDRLETLTFAGIVTRYTFTPTRHLGFDTDDLALLRWSAARGTASVPSDARGGAR